MVCAQKLGSSTSSDAQLGISARTHPPQAIYDLDKGTERQSIILLYKYGRIVERVVKQDGHLTKANSWLYLAVMSEGAEARVRSNETLPPPTSTQKSLMGPPSVYMQRLVPEEVRVYALTQHTQSCPFSLHSSFA